MKFGKKIVFVVFMVVFVLVFVGCVGGGDVIEEGFGGDGGSGDGEMYIVFVLKGFQYQFWQVVKKGVEEKVDEFGVWIIFEGLVVEIEIVQQLEMLIVVIDKNLDVIVYVVFDFEVCVVLFEQVKLKDIFVVYFDVLCNGDVGFSFFVIDSKVVGVFVVEYMVDLIGGEGEVVIVGYLQINLIGVECCDGFVEKIEVDYFDIKIVDIQYGDGDYLKLVDIVKMIIVVYFDFKGIYGMNEGLVIGVVNVVNEFGFEKGKIIIVGFDFGVVQINVIKDGMMVGVIIQDLIGIGVQVVQVVYDVVNGDDVDEFYDIGFYWYDKNNFEDDKIVVVFYE